VLSLWASISSNFLASLSSDSAEIFSSRGFASPKGLDFFFTGWGAASVATIWEGGASELMMGS